MYVCCVLSCTFCVRVRCGDNTIAWGNSDERFGHDFSSPLDDGPPQTWTASTDANNHRQQVQHEHRSMHSDQQLPDPGQPQFTTVSADGMVDTPFPATVFSSIVDGVAVDDDYQQHHHHHHRPSHQHRHHHHQQLYADDGVAGGRTLDQHSFGLATMQSSVEFNQGPMNENATIRPSTAAAVMQPSAISQSSRQSSYIVSTTVSSTTAIP